MKNNNNRNINITSDNNSITDIMSYLQLEEAF